MKRQQETRRGFGWLPLAGWALSVGMLIVLGIIQTRHQEELRQQKADQARVREEWARKETAYRGAARFLNLYTNAPAAINMAQVLRDIGAVNTGVIVPDNFKSRINSDDLKARLDVDLRQAGITLDAKANFELSIVVDGSWYDAEGMVMPMLSLNLNESVPVRRGDSFSLISVASYRASRFSIVKAAQVQDVMTKMIESLVESFAKDYAAVNKK